MFLRRKTDILGSLHEYLVKEKNKFFFSFSFLFVFLRNLILSLDREHSSEMLKRCETTNFNWKFNIFYHAPNNNPLAKKLLLAQLLWICLVCDFVVFFFARWWVIRTFLDNLFTKCIFSYSLLIFNASSSKWSRDLPRTAVSSVHAFFTIEV